MASYCEFVEDTEYGLYCSYSDRACDYQKCSLYIYGVGKEDLKGVLVGTDMCGNPIYKD